MNTSLITISRWARSRQLALLSVLAILLSTFATGLTSGAALSTHTSLIQKSYVMRDPPSDPNWNRLQQDLEFFRKLREMGVNPAAYVSAQAADRPGFELPKRAVSDLVRLAQLNSVRPYQPPAVAPDQALPLGGVNLPLDALASGMVISGGTGSGKTTAILRIIDHCSRKQIKSRFWDFKGEARRFHQFWPCAMVFDPKTAPWQWLHPPDGCDPLNYFIGVIAELRNEVELRPETFPLAYGLYERILRGLRAGDAFPSWSDFRRVLEHEAAAQKRENLFTLARAFQSIEVVLGANARVRVAPFELADQYSIVGYDLVGLDPALIRLFLGLHFNRLLHDPREHTTGLRFLEIIDEAGPIGSTEVVLRTAGTLSSIKRFATMSRFTGTGLILGIQNLSTLDPFLKNAATLMVFRAPSVDDAVEAAKMLGLPREATDELMRMGVGDVWVRSAGWLRPVKTHIDAFEP